MKQLKYYLEIISNSMRPERRQLEMQIEAVCHVIVLSPPKIFGKPRLDLI